MMYVSGETADPSIQTIGLIEEIVRNLVVELVSQFHCSALSSSER